MKKQSAIIYGVFICNICIGGWSINQILSWLGKNIPWYFDCLIGLFTGQFSIPVAIIGKILKCCGIF